MVIILDHLYLACNKYPLIQNILVLKDEKQDTCLGFFFAVIRTPCSFKILIALHCHLLIGSPKVVDVM